MRDDVKIKPAVTVSEMARMVGLSRQRFYQLMSKTFPPPVYDPYTRRPFYTAEQQAVCLEVRRRNCGVNGKPVLFYAPRADTAVASRKPDKRRDAKAKPASAYTPIVEGVRALGLGQVSAAQVEQAVGQLYPNGIAELEESEVIRAVFVHLMRQNSADNVGR